jgi:hypothetical protein
VERGKESHGRRVTKGEGRDKDKGRHRKGHDKKIKCDGSTSHVSSSVQTYYQSRKKNKKNKNKGESIKKSSNVNIYVFCNFENFNREAPATDILLKQKSIQN